VIEIRIPRKELKTEFIYKLDCICNELSVQACVTVVDVIPMHLGHITVKGELIIEEEDDA
jgi:hypothetical protein